VPAAPAAWPARPGLAAAATELPVIRRFSRASGGRCLSGRARSGRRVPARGGPGRQTRR